MTVVTRRFVWFAAIVALLSSPVIFLASDLGKPSSVLAKEWVSGLSPSELDRAATEIRHLPPAYRKLVLVRLSPARRADVWRQTLSAFVSTNTELSPEHKAQLQHVAESLTPELFDFEGNQMDPERRTLIVAAAQKTAAFLSKEQIHSLFLTPGPTSVPGSAEPLRIRAARYVQSKLGVQAAVNPDCACHDHNPNSWEDCPGSGNCVLGGSFCTWQWWGCGWWGIENCEGICFPFND